MTFLFPIWYVKEKRGRLLLLSKKGKRGLPTRVWNPHARVAKKRD